MDSPGLLIFTAVVTVAAVAQLPLTVQFFRDMIINWRMAHDPDIARRYRGDFTPCEKFPAAPIYDNSVSSFPSLMQPQPRQQKPNKKYEDRPSYEDSMFW